MNFCFWHFLVKTVIWYFSIYVICGQTYEEYNALESVVLSGYNKHTIPLKNQSSVLKMNISMILYSMPEVDSVGGSITLTCVTLCTWYDEIIKWKPSDHGGVSSIYFTVDDIWNPTITLGTPVEFVTMGQSWMRLTVSANGLVVYTPGAVIKSLCKFNTRFWPFDKQVCDVMFFPYAITKDKLLLNIPEYDIDTQYYSPNTEWTLEKTSSFMTFETGYSQAHFKLKMKRQSLFYLLTVIVPIAGLWTLSCLVFLLPSESGERIGYSLTIMLSLAVFMTVIADKIPKSSEPISLICIYILMGIMFSLTSTILVMLNLVLHHRSDTIPVGAWYQAFVRFKCPWSRNRLIHISQHDTGNTLVRSLTREYKTRPFFVKGDVISKGSKTVNDNMTADIPDCKQTKVTWKDVSCAIDTLLLYGLAVLSFIPSVIFLFYIAFASSYDE